MMLPSTIPSMDGEDSSSFLTSPSKSMMDRNESMSTSSGTNTYSLRSESTSQRGDSGGLSAYVGREYSSRRKCSAAKDRLGIGALRFDKLGVYGRQNEKELIRKCINRSSFKRNNHINGDDDCDAQKCEFVLVSGVSGCGKTTLARSVAKSATKNVNGLFVEGKFEMSNQGDPYTGIKKACMQLCGELLYYLQKKTTTIEEASKFLQDMKDDLGSEIGVLLDLIPELEEVMEYRRRQQRRQKQHQSLDDSNLPEISSDNDNKNDVAISTTGNMVTEASKSKLHNVFRRFIRLISTRFAPLVMFMDDLQRADNSSLDLLHSIMSNADTVGGGLVVVGTYRSNEVDANTQHKLSQYIVMLKEEGAARMSYMQLTEIKLENFSQRDVKGILTTLMGMDDSPEIDRLASICYKRTLGNMFHLNFFLRDIAKDGLLQFNIGLRRWKWNENSIMSSTAASNNVVDLMRQRLLELPKLTQNQLSLAACLGASFDLKTYEIVWMKISDSISIGYNDDDTATDWLEVSIDNSILEMIGDDDHGIEYRWAHDQIQSAALDIYPPEDLPSFKSMIGQALLNEISRKKANEKYIFAIADLLNSGTTTGSDDTVLKLELAEVNRRATVKASELVALHSVLHYARSGVQNLPADAWENHYDVTLELYSQAAGASNLLGLTEELDTYAGTILNQKDRPLTDKLRAYKALIDNKTRLDDNESIKANLEMLLDVMAQLGCRFPKGKFMRLISTVKILLKVKKKVKTLTVGDVLTDPRKIDPFQLQVMEFLATLMDSVYGADPGLLGLWILTFGQIALNNGICKYSQAAYAQLGIVFLTMNDFTTAEKCGLISEQLMKTFDFKDTNANAAYQVYAFSLAFRRPFHKIHESLKDGYRDGLSVGDNSSSGACCVFYNYMSLYASLPLRTMDADLCRYISQMKEINNEQGQTNLTMLWQCVLNLLGKSDDPCVLQGKAIPDLEAFQESITLENSKCLLFYVQSFLLAIFGEYEKGAALALENGGRFQKAGPGLFMNMHETFVRGLHLFCMAKRCPKTTKYKRAARKALSTISGWAKKDNPNVLHYEKLLKAELCSLNGKLDSAQLLYHQALSLASRSGLIQDAAIINERCAEFFLKERKSVDDATKKMMKSIKLYEEWGCCVKADMLRAQHDSIKPPPSVLVVR